MHFINRAQAALIPLLLSMAIHAIAQDDPVAPLQQEDLFEKSHTLVVPQQDEIVVWPWLGSPVDFNADGSEDIIVFGHHSTDAYIWYSGAGEAVLLPEDKWFFNGMNPLWLDVDSDGDFDAIGTYGRNVADYVFVNNNGELRKAGKDFDYPIDDLDDLSSWIDFPDHLSSYSPHPLGAKFRENFYVDLDNDQIDERVVNYWGQNPENVSQYQIHTWVLGKTGRRQWSDITATIGIADGNSRILFPDDIDVDGDIDLVDVHRGDLFINDNGHFTLANHKLFDGDSPYNGDGSLQVIDLDNNGFRDYVFGYDHHTSHGIYMNYGSGFSRLEGEIINPNRRMRRFYDMDSDGDMDLVSFNGSDEITVWRNITENAGAWVRYEGSLFGPSIRIEQAGKLVHYRQRAQESRMTRSNPYNHFIHVGGIDPEAELTVSVTESQH